MAIDAVRQPDGGDQASAAEQAAADQRAADQAAERSWVWDRNRGYAALARLASVRALEGLALLDREAYAALPVGTLPGDGAVAAESAAVVAAHLYKALCERSYPYHLPAWSLGQRQRIRDPRAIQQGAATCLDISLLLAAMCKAAGLRPFVAILEHHRERQSDHALLIVDLRSRSDAGPPPVPAGPAREVVWGVWQLANSAPSALRDGVIAVEVTSACRNRHTDFAEACRQGKALIEGGGYRDVHLVDVIAAQRGLVVAYSEAAEEADPPVQRPAIYPNLPVMPHFHDYQSRAALAEQLHGATGTAVIGGGSGTGKSMLAHHVAMTIDHGCGWFLDASSERVLTMALAAGEAREAGRDPSSVDATEAKGLAVLARGRLHGAAGPWVVVLDNANLPPDELRNLLPRPDISKGQLLIITTTNPAWAEHADRPAELPPLDGAEVQGDLDRSAPLEAIAGRPLLVTASRRFRAGTARWWWADQPVLGDDQAGQAPARFWAAVDGELGGGELARTAAWVIGWLPPIRIPLAIIGAVLDNDGEVGAAIGRLRDLGLVDVEAGEVTMHRLFREAVRAAGLDRSVAEQTLLICKILASKSASDLVESAADLATAREMGRLLAVWPDVDVAVVGLHRLGSIFERQETAASSARWYQQVLDRLAEATTTDHRLREVDALRGLARARMRAVGEVGREQRLAELDEAVAWTIRAAGICSGSLRGGSADGASADGACADRASADRAFEVAASQVMAMRGLLLREKAGVESGDPDAELRLLREAEQLLRDSARDRRRLVEDPDNSPEVDRSQYNLPGLEVGLAQRDAREAAAHHLDEADRHYAQILQTRRDRYHTDDMEEVVCCINGQAIVAYYRAMLLDLPLTVRSELLRLATDRAHEATLIRQGLTAELDDTNTAKSVALAAKIALARLRVTEAAGVRADRDENSIGDYREERDRLLAAIAQSPPQVPGENA
jgi:hypothetical protein